MLLPTNGAIGNGFIITFVVAAALVHPPALAVIVKLYAPAIASVALVITGF